MTIRRVNVQTGEVEILNEDAPSFPSQAPTDAALAARYDGPLGDLVDWIAQQNGKTPQQARAELVAISKSRKP